MVTLTEPPINATSNKRFLALNEILQILLSIEIFESRVVFILKLKIALRRVILGQDKNQILDTVFEKVAQFCYFVSKIIC